MKRNTNSEVKVVIIGSYEVDDYFRIILLT